MDLDKQMEQRQIFLFSVIDEWSGEWVIRQLLAMDKESDAPITIFISSRGGTLNHMFAIIDTMKIVKSKIRTVVVGTAASAAAVIASSGDEKMITQTAQIMIHEAWSGIDGSITQMQDGVEQIAKRNKLMVELIAKNTGRVVTDIEEVINKKDKYFNAEEALSFGLVDKIIQDDEARVLKLSEQINVEGYEIDGKEIQILREGKYVHPVYGEMLISNAIMETMKRNYDNNVRGCDISIDYTHDNENGESPAAFWFKSLEIRTNKDGKGKGLFARGEFTPKGEKVVSEKEYKYSSADFVIDYIDQAGKHYPYVLRGGTLTNRPFIKNMNPIKLSEEFQTSKKESITMTKEELIAALKGHGIDVTALMSGGEAMAKQVKDLEAKIVELNSLPAQKEAEIKALKDELEAATQKIVDGDKLKAFNALVVEGKCIPAQKDEIFSTFDSAEAITGFYKNAPKAVVTKAAGSGDEGESSLTAEEQQLVNMGEFTKEEIIAGRSPKKTEPTA